MSYMTSMTSYFPYISAVQSRFVEADRETLTYIHTRTPMIHKYTASVRRLMLYAVCLQLQSQISVCVHEVAVVDEQQSTTSQHCQDGGPRVLYESTSTRTRSPSKALSTLATIVVEFGDYSRRKRRQFVAEFGDSHQNGAIDSRRFR